MSNEQVVVQGIQTVEIVDSGFLVGHLGAVLVVVIVRDHDRCMTESFAKVFGEGRLSRTACTCNRDHERCRLCSDAFQLSRFFVRLHGHDSPYASIGRSSFSSIACSLHGLNLYPM